MDESQNRLKLIAKSQAATDFHLVEVAAREAGLEAEYLPEKLFRSQCSEWSLAGRYQSIEQVLRIVDSLDGYELTKYAREELAATPLAMVA
jgi:hypothetical protein